jgi:hypothetical protein
MRMEHMLPLRATRAVCLVHRARPPCTAPSYLQAMFTHTFVFTNTHGLRYTDTTIEALGYKQTDLMANFAGTLTLPDRISSTAVLMHGATRVEHWVTRAALPETNGVGISLVVSDWGDADDLTAFAASLGGIQGVPHPFTSMVLLTQNESTAAAAQATHTSLGLQAIARNWTAGTAEWDMCTAPVSTPWFVLVTSRFRARSRFALPVTKGALRPLAPYKRRDSLFCDCVCKDRIDAAAQIYPGFEFDIAPQHAVLHTATRDVYCDLARQSSTSPSINGYFAHVIAEAGSEEASMYVWQHSAVHCIHSFVHAGCNLQATQLLHDQLTSLLGHLLPLSDKPPPIFEHHPPLSTLVHTSASLYRSLPSSTLRPASITL